jgi:uncharacterized protein YggE
MRWNKKRHRILLIMNNQTPNGEFSMKRLIRFAPSLLIIAILISVPACANNQNEKLLSRIMVTGEADVQAPPDTAVLILSVITQNQRALDAQQQNARKSDAVMRAVKEAEANAEIKTSDYSLQPQRNWNGNIPRIVGYEARNSVTVTTATLDKVGALIDAATSAGANSVENVSFILRESNAARGQTLAAASKQAMAKAQAMAQALGGRVVRVIEEQEGGFTNRPMTIDETMAAYKNVDNAQMNLSAAKARTPVESGPLNVRSQVQLIVEIEVKP